MSLRRSPLPQRSEPMRRRSGLRRTEWKRVTKHVAAGRRASRANPFPPSVAALLDARDEWCQRCGSTRDLERHHRRGKAIGGSRNRGHGQCACNGLRLCRRCHAWAHRGERAEAQAQGFIVSQSVAFPGSVGVMRGSADGGGALMWPDCDGNWLGTAAEAGEAA